MKKYEIKFETEEDARDFYFDYISQYVDNEDVVSGDFIREMKKDGYIK